MKKYFYSLCFIILSLGLVYYITEISESKKMIQEELPTRDFIEEAENKHMSNSLKIIDVNITINNQLFPSKFYHNKTTEAFIAQLPLKITMSDFNSNEKFQYLSTSLPTNPEKPNRIHAGDIMLYGNDGLVLFYKSLPTNYRYTRLGYIEDITKLAQTLGNEDIDITIDLLESKSK